MRILIISFYYEPDLCAGSFRTTAFVKALERHLKAGDTVEVVTTLPNRYSTYKVESSELQARDNVTIRRIRTPSHKSAFFDQARAFRAYFIGALKYTGSRKYDIVFATSSRLFSALLGAIISKQQNIPLYLDIRDIFVDTMKSILKNSRLKVVIPLFNIVEKLAVSRAQKINLVSSGFASYFQEKYRRDYSFFPNGIDDEFLRGDFNSPRVIQSDRVIFTYTGNIGEGQGLEKIVPKIAERYKNIEFRIVGDGGRRSALEECTSQLKNVKLMNPVNRKELGELYNQSDVLFLHLNNHDAFRKVLPSKIFEYAATYRPIIAGVEGYAKEFLADYLPDSVIFRSCDFDDFCRKYDQFNGAVDLKARKEFIAKFSRFAIMDAMAKDFLSLRMSV